MDIRVKKMALEKSIIFWKKRLKFSIKINRIIKLIKLIKIVNE